MNSGRSRILAWLVIPALAFLGFSPRAFTQTDRRTPRQLLSTIAPADDSNTIEFAVIGDYGAAATGHADSERAVAKMVEQWDPGFIITLGDNNYKNGQIETIVQNIGKYYCGYIYNQGAPDKQQCQGWANNHRTNLFFPSLGNHDWYTVNAQAYIDYFAKLPRNDRDNTRFYDFVQGPVHFFALDSESREACEEDWCEGESPCAECEKDNPIHYEPDGASPDSRQGRWLHDRLKDSKSPWNIVYFHHAPYTCKNSSKWMRWPFQEWGVNAVLAGHKHRYERGWLKGDSDFPYFVNGVGGTKLSECDPDDCSNKFEEVIFQGIYGAMWIRAKTDEIRFEFYEATGKGGTLLDRCTLAKSSSGQKLTCEVIKQKKAEYCPEQ
jgi:hypothetical protein